LVIRYFLVVPMYAKLLNCARWPLTVALLGSLVGAGGCVELWKGAGAAPPAGTDLIAADAARSPGNGIRSVYVKGATPDWDAGLTPTPSAARSEYFEIRLFGGGCPGFDLFARSVGWTKGDPFGPVATEEPGLLRASTSHDGWGGRGLFDPMPLGGESPRVLSWQTLGMYGLADGGCHSAFLPLLRFGSSEPLLVAK
jgi:hypothetical protein